MRDRKTPTPTDFEETAGFRATLLYLFPPERVETVKKFGRLLYYMILAGEPYYPDEESQTRRELQAAREDLLHVQAFLEYIARKPEDLDLRPPDLRLCRFAGKLVHSVGRVIAEIEKQMP